MRRWVCTLLAFALVPVLIVSAPGVAAAATVYGDPATGSPSYSGGMSGQGVDCEVTGYWVVPATGSPSIKVKGSCSRGWISPWEDLTLYADAPGCNMASDYENDSEQGGFEMTMTPSSLLPFDAATCVLTTGEAHFIDPDCVENDASDDVCFQTDTFAWELGAPPSAGADNSTNGDCPNFTINTVPVLKAFEYAAYPAGYGSYSGSLKYHLKYGNAGLVWKSPPSTTQTVSTNYVYRLPNGTYAVTMVNSPGDASTGASVWGPPTLTSPVVDWWPAGSTSQTNDGRVFVGIQYQLGSGTLQLLGNRAVLPQNGTTQAPGSMGLTDPSKCAFYFGPKIAETPNDLLDEPAGPVSMTDPTAPAPEPTPLDPVADPQADADKCTGFSFRDPATWAGAGMCMVVSALADIWDKLGAVVRAVGRIAQQILDGLAALFVPNPSSWGWSGLVDQAKARPPFSVVAGAGEGVQSIATAYEGGGGCGSLADFTSEDIQADLTCTQAKESTGMGTLYGIVQLALWSLTGLGIFKMIAGAVGSNS